ncbi:MAG TPA: hypothetical protein VFN22_09765 [Gemmatimonadales bacterium]|nr:hypothetical protein [Gemmatimonadales bacterium]
MRHLQTIALIATIGLASACGDSSPTGTGDTAAATFNADVMAAAADAFAEDVDVMAGMSGTTGWLGASSALNDGPPDGPGNVNGCGFGGGRWACPPNPANGLTLTRSIAFFDAAGGVQEAYDPATTATIDVVATLEGDGARGPWTASIFRTRHLTWTGLEGTETVRTVNGNGSEEISRERQADNAPARSYAIVGEFTVQDVVMPVRAPGIIPWPLSGTITRTWTVTRDDQASVTRTVVITFDGTSTPTATVNGEPFEIDLAARHARRR